MTAGGDVVEPRVLRRGELDNAAADQAWRLLRKVDHEFVPALSARDSTTTKALAGDGGGRESSPTGPVTYFRGLRDQACIGAWRNGDLVGLMSFIVGHREDLLAGWSPCTYISTVAVDPEHRRTGVADRLYRAVLTLPAELASPYVATRTWSTNDSHLPLLTRHGFMLVVRLPHHRGNGIDTVYYARPVA